MQKQRARNGNSSVAACCMRLAPDQRDSPSIGAPARSRATRRAKSLSRVSHSPTSFGTAINGSAPNLDFLGPPAIPAERIRVRGTCDSFVLVSSGGGVASLSDGEPGRLCVWGSWQSTPAASLELKRGRPRQPRSECVCRAAAPSPIIMGSRKLTVSEIASPRAAIGESTPLGLLGDRE